MNDYMIFVAPIFQYQNISNFFQINNQFYLKDQKNTSVLI